MLETSIAVVDPAHPALATVDRSSRAPITPPRWWRIASYASAAALLLSLLGCWMTLANPTRVTLLDDAGSLRSVKFPYADPSAPTSSPMEFAFHVRKTLLTPTFFVLVPDDHLLSMSVNGRSVSLCDVDPGKLDDYNRGFSYPLGPKLEDGDNTVVVRVINQGGGPGGLDVHADLTRGLGLLPVHCAMFAAIALLCASMRDARCRWPSIAFAGVALAIRFAYLWVTPMIVRAHDASEHLDYVRYLLEHHSLPKAADGWAFYHPPLYYIVTALLYGGLEAAGFREQAIEAALQVESVAFQLGFAAFAVATVRLWLGRLPGLAPGWRLLGRDGLALLCAALILFWPTSVLHSVRVGNDDLAYLWFGAALYFGSRWWVRGREGERRDFYVAAAAAALGVVTKSHSLILFVVLGAALGVRIYQDPALQWRKALTYAWPLALLFVLSAGIDLHEALGALIEGKQDYLFVGNAHRTNPALILTNRPLYFLWFDFRTYFSSPFTSAWEDAKGRQYFWNYLLKTSLFGEWEFDQNSLGSLGTALSVLVFAMLPVAMAGALLRKRSEIVEDLPGFAIVLLLVGGLLAQRLSTPVFHGDFRYALPAIIPLSYWYARALVAQVGRGWVWVARAGAALAWVFVGLSVGFIGAVFWTSA